MFRRLEDADHSSVISFIKEIMLAKNTAGFNWSEQNLKTEFELAECFVLENQEQVVAFAAVRKLPTGFELTCLAVHLSGKGQGFGSFLMSELMKLKINSATSQSQEFWLEVHEKNHSARRLYSRFGFKVVGQRKNYYSGGGDALLMSLSLPR